MELALRRDTAKERTTMGELWEGFVFQCDILEDKVREMRPDEDGDGIAEGKIMGETAIPAGRYEVIIRWSNRFQRRMMALVDVRFFTSILIHAGNTHHDTKGCLLTGKRNVDATQILGGTSTKACDALFEKVEAAITRGERVWITITDDFKQAKP